MFDLSRFAALTFDCYGTIIDWETGIREALDRHATRREFAAPEIESFLAAFGRLETSVQQANPGWLYPRVLEECFTQLATAFAFPATADDARAFGESVGEWPPFPDSSEALRRLQSRSALIVASNVDRESFRRSESRLGVKFDGIVTAQDVSAYKPDPRMFDAAVRKAAELGVPRERVLHVAQSIFHDISPANRLGIACVWVDRRAGRPGGATPEASARPDLRVESLRELADLVERGA